MIIDNSDTTIQDYSEDYCEYCGYYGCICDDDLDEDDDVLDEEQEVCPHIDPTGWDRDCPCIEETVWLD